MLPYILHMVEAEGRAAACVLQGLSGEGFIMAVDETEIRIVKRRNLHMKISKKYNRH